MRPIEAISWPEQSQDRLILRAQRGEEQAFAALFDLHKRSIYSLCLRAADSAAEAEDMTKKIFLRVFREIPAFHDEHMFSTRLYELTANAMSIRLQASAALSLA
ncbi:MAG: sigma factor [Terriglobia bacterium]